MVFDLKPGVSRAHIGDCLRVFHEGCGRVVDISPLHGTAECNVGAFAERLGVTNDLFVAEKPG